MRLGALHVPRKCGEYRMGAESGRNIPLILRTTFAFAARGVIVTLGVGA